MPLAVQCLTARAFILSEMMVQRYTHPLRLYLYRKILQMPIYPEFCITVTYRDGKEDRFYYRDEQEVKVIHSNFSYLLGDPLVTVFSPRVGVVVFLADIRKIEFRPEGKD